MSLIGAMGLGCKLESKPTSAPFENGSQICVDAFPQWPRQHCYRPAGVANAATVHVSATSPCNPVQYNHAHHAPLPALGVLPTANAAPINTCSNKIRLS